MLEGSEMTDQVVCCHSESFGSTQDKLREESFLKELRSCTDGKG
jgi:hypothetical protein